MKIGRKTAVLIVLLLLITFGWHIIHTDHVHYEAQYGKSVEAVFHDDNRKWLTFLLAFIFTLSFAKINLLPKVGSITTKPIIYFPPDIPKFVDSISLALQNGILHPKIYNY